MKNITIGDKNYTDVKKIKVKETETGNYAEFIDAALGTKTITSNGTYNASDDNLDGYSSVEVATSGVDINEYFDSKPETISSSSYWLRDNYFKKMPEIIIPNSCTSLSYFCAAGPNDNYTFNITPKVICGNNVTNTNNMYYRCQCPNIDVSGLDMSNVTNMSYMFTYCIGPTTIDFSGWNTSKVQNMSNMFQWSSKLLNLDLSNFDTSSLTNISNMFYACNAITEINMNNLNFEKVTNVSGMFTTCNKLNDLSFGVNLGKGYTQKRANYSSYKLDLSPSTLLTHDSLMSVINNLYDLNLTYDVANGGTLYNQQLVLGTTNLAKLTEEEIAIATNKGWTVS